jgi:hypothetical protein
MPTTKGTFIRRTEKLQERIGSGKVQAGVRVDQIYAQYQHERMDLKHYGIGGPKFLSTALMQNHVKWLEQIGRHLYSPLGVNHWMERIAINMASESKRRTPMFLSDLRKSHEARVKEHGRFIYRDGTVRPRLHKSELRAKARLWNQMHRGS